MDGSAISDKHRDRSGVDTVQLFQALHLPLLSGSVKWVQASSLLHVLAGPCHPPALGLSRAEGSSAWESEGNSISLGPDIFFASFPSNRMSIGSTQAFYLLVDSNRTLVSMSSTMAEVYAMYKDEDGFLYMTYASQEMFG